jgi:hypothetical protein
VSAAGEWSAVVQPRAGGGWEAILTLRGQTQLWPDSELPGRSDARCRAWVRRRLAAELDRQRWVAYLGAANRVSRRRGSWATSWEGRPRNWATREATRARKTRQSR